MTKENAKDYLPFVQALAQGKTIQIWYNTKWNDAEGVSFNSNPDRYRIKPEPNPKLRPWTDEEVPVGALIRAKDWPAGRTVISNAVGGMIYDCTPQGLGRHAYSADVARDELEHSLDLGKTWLPCGVLEGQV